MEAAREVEQVRQANIPSHLFGVEISGTVTRVGDRLSSKVVVSMYNLTNEGLVPKKLISPIPVLGEDMSETWGEYSDGKDEGVEVHRFKVLETSDCSLDEVDSAKHWVDNQVKLAAEEVDEWLSSLDGGLIYESNVLR